MIFKHVTLLLILVSLAAAEDTNFSYNGFQSANLSVEDTAGVTPDGFLRLTYNIINNTGQQKGSAFYPTPVIFKNSSNGTVFSFSTTFVFAIRSESGDPGGQGLAFVVAPTRGLPLALAGPYFGLFNGTNNGNPANHVFCIELDVNEDFQFNDIDENHVGIDINGLNDSSMSHKAGYNAQKNGTFRSLHLLSGEPMQVWVDYDGTQKQINVSLAPIDDGKPYIPLLSYTLDLSPVLNKAMYVGFSASSGSVPTSHYVLGWSFNMNGKAQELVKSQLPKLPPTYPAPEPAAFAPSKTALRAPKKRSELLTVGMPVIIFVALVSLAIYFVVSYFIRRKKKFAELLEDWELEYGPQRFKYKELYIATKGFREKELLGKGGFGKVYKGVLPTSKIEIAVKRVSHESRQGMKEFVAEIVSNGQLRHRNLVPLLGYCRRKEELLLVYEYMPNGSLDKYLYCQLTITLNWSQRFRVIRGVASGLLYLHEEWDQVVVHRDVKASNVLLDKECNARLGDFGLARLYDHNADPESTTHIAGTFGYLAPEFIRSLRATTSTDVFAFGVFLLEVACGRRPIVFQSSDVILVDWVCSCWMRSNILEAKDPNLGTEFIAEEVELVLKLGLLCTHSEPSARPRMRQVVQYLEGDIALPADLSLVGVSVSGSLVFHNDFATGRGLFQSSYVAESLVSGGR